MSLHITLMCSLKTLWSSLEPSNCGAASPVESAPTAGDDGIRPAPSAAADAIFQPCLMRGRVLFVTGGGSGIGLGICCSFAKLGAKVAICGRSEEKLKKAEATIREHGAEDVMYVQADVRKPEECKAAADQVGVEWGKIDILVNNAAGNFMSLLEDTSKNAWDTVIGIDLGGTFNMSTAALPWLRKAAVSGSGAAVLNISATLYYSGIPFQGHAAAAKAGIDSLTKTMAAEWAGDGIRVVSVAPGPVADTEGGPTGRVFGAAQLKDIRSSVPLGRWVEIDDIANTVVFLASPGGSSITGTNIVVDGMSWQAGSLRKFSSNKDAIRAMVKMQKENRERGSRGSKDFKASLQPKL